MKRLAPLLLLCALAAPPAWADDSPKPVVPVASIVVPATAPLVVFADGSVSKTPADWQAIDPADAKLRVAGDVLLVLDPTPGRTYELALIAYGDTPPVKLAIRKVTAPGPAPVVVTPPSPDNPAPPIVAPPPVAAPDLGMTAAARAIVSKPGWSAGAIDFRRTTLAKAYADQVPLAAGYKTAAEFDKAAGPAVMARLPAATRGQWKAVVIDPINLQLAALAQAGKIATAADLAEAFREISTALAEEPTPDVNDRR